MLLSPEQVQEAIVEYVRDRSLISNENDLVLSSLCFYLTTAGTSCEVKTEKRSAPGQVYCKPYVEVEIYSGDKKQLDLRSSAVSFEDLIENFPLEATAVEGKIIVLKKVSQHRALTSKEIVDIRTRQFVRKMESLNDLIKDELNVKEIKWGIDDGTIGYAYKPDLKKLGPKYRHLLPQIRRAFEDMPKSVFSPLRDGKSILLDVGEEITITPEEVFISADQNNSDWKTATENGVTVALCTTLTPDLIYGGLARDYIHGIQATRKEMGLDVKDRVKISYQRQELLVEVAIERFTDLIKEETMCDKLVPEYDATGFISIQVGPSSQCFQVPTKVEVIRCVK